MRYERFVDKPWMNEWACVKAKETVRFGRCSVVEKSCVYGFAWAWAVTVKPDHDVHKPLIDSFLIRLYAEHTIESSEWMAAAARLLDFVYAVHMVLVFS